MLSHARNGEAGRLRDVHSLDKEELVAYGLAHHVIIGEMKNALSKELAGREVLRQHYPDVEVSRDAGNADDRTLARARLCWQQRPVLGPAIKSLTQLAVIGHPTIVLGCDQASCCRSG